jgi:para-aminobenzoate synthetase/4-amino-4-deoxychorismate lyase
MRALIDFPGTGARCRHAFSQPQAVLRADELVSVPSVIARAYEHARAGAWVVGHVAYEAAPAFDGAMRVHAARSGLPLACFAVYAQTSADLAWDRVTARLVAPPRWTIDGPWSSLLDRTEAARRMDTIRAAIARGEVYQVNLTTRLHASFGGDPLAYFRALCHAQPGGYSLYLDAGSWQVLSVSPELFFDWTPQGVLSARPMKGTAARHADPQRDAASMRRMQDSAKERAENLMIVDLLRNDLSRVALPGSVRVPALFVAEALATAWQMTSSIECRTRAGVGLDDIFRVLFPCGSVTGAPKIAAMAAIRALESTARGIYCGALGVIRPGGHATFNVGIRTVYMDSAVDSAAESAAGGAGKRAECGVGSGITWDSVAADEWEEWQVKQRFLERAAAGR